MMGTGSVLPSFKETTKDPECFRHPFPRTEGLKKRCQEWKSENKQKPQRSGQILLQRGPVSRVRAGVEELEVCALLLPPGRASPSFQDVKWVAASLGGEAQPGSAQCCSDGDCRAPAQRFPEAGRCSPLFASPLCEEEAGEGGARAATQLPEAPSRSPGGETGESGPL